MYKLSKSKLINQSLLSNILFRFLNQLSTQRINYHYDGTLPTDLPCVTSTAKRFLDVVGALVGLTITAILYIPIAVAIYLDDPGPIFFSQTRVGLHGRTFRIWKFRSMIKDAERQKHLIKNEANGYIFKNENDPRITKVGHFLRRTSIDEFPQFINVLRGEMSLVGTRPPTLDEVEKYSPYHWRRLHVKPGLTGEWQVNGRSEIKDFEKIVALDIRYQNKWSVVYDLKLILMTVLAMFTKKGAC